MDNMELWNKVQTTDPKYTKPVSFGKYHFTDIDSTWNIKRATELWGPYGSTWGLKEFYVNVFHAGEDVAGVYIQGMFYYPGGSFSIAADIPYDPRGEVLKKLQTMCIGKALSRLGFSADVYEGRFDDSAYVKEMEKQYGSAANISADSSGSGVSPTQPVKRSKKTVNYPEPDPNASGILGSLSQKYMDIVAGDEQYSGMVVSFSKVCHAVYDEFGMYPTKIESIPMLIEKVPVSKVIEKNDFLEGL